MKEEVHVRHSKLFQLDGGVDFNLLDHKDLDPDFKKQIAFDALFNVKTSKFDLSKLSGVDKLIWLSNADSIIDFALTYPCIEAVHEFNSFKPLIDAEINGKELSVSIEDLELDLGIEFKDHNYKYYLHFNISTNPMKMPKLIETKDLIYNIIKYNYTKQDFFFSVPFINSLIDRKKSKEVNLSFVAIPSLKGDKTLGIKAAFGRTKTAYNYYDISYNPPTEDGPGMTNSPESGSPMNFVVPSISI